MSTVADKQAGFSLIETLVAMTVLAVSATAILSATETHTRTVAAVTERRIAGWVAQDALVSLSITGAAPTPVRMGQRDWQVTTTQTATRDTDLARVDISVAAATAPETELARLTGFVDIAGQVAQ